MLIDSGENDDKVFDKINCFLKNKKVKKIDYLLITHPESDHAGGAARLVENYKIYRAYLPDIDQEMLAFYTSYERFYTALEQTDTEIKISELYRNQQTNRHQHPRPIDQPMANTPPEQQPQPHHRKDQYRRCNDNFLHFIFASASFKIA